MKVKVWEIPEGWRLINTNPWAPFETISKIMLRNGSEIEVVPGTYVEMVNERHGAEVYLGVETWTNANVVGNAKEIICQWFVNDQRPTVTDVPKEDSTI